MEVQGVRVLDPDGVVEGVNDLIDRLVWSRAVSVSMILSKLLREPKK